VASLLLLTGKKEEKKGEGKRENCTFHPPESLHQNVSVMANRTQRMKGRKGIDLLFEPSAEGEKKSREGEGREGKGTKTVRIMKRSQKKELTKLPYEEKGKSTLGHFRRFPAGKGRGGGLEGKRQELVSC